MYHVTITDKLGVTHVQTFPDDLSAQRAAILAREEGCEVEISEDAK